MHPAPASLPARSPALERAVRFFEGIAPADAARMGELYTDDAFFKDPFNEVTGPAAIGRIFSAMFVQVAEPRFVVREAIEQGAQAFLVWDFEFRFRRGDTRAVQRIRGGTHLRFAPDGRIAWHRDYWDAAEELYEKIPLLGGFMRWIKRRAQH